MPSITPLGKKWENLHSFWLVWLLFIYKYGFLSFIAFFYIGIRARQNKWIFAGCVYLSVVVIFLFTKQLGNTDNVVFDLALGLFLFAYVTSWVHAFWVRHEYLQIIAEKEMAKRVAKEEKSIEQVMSSPQERKKAVQIDLRGLKPILINSASKVELAAITGGDLADKIIQLRNRNGHFHSLTDLIRHIQIKPHLLAKMKKYILFDDETTEQLRDRKTTKRSSRGRMVDY